MVALMSTPLSRAGQPPGPDTPPVFVEKLGSFNHSVSIKPDDQLIFEFPVQFTTCTVSVKPQFDAKLDIQIYQDGAVVAKDVGGPIKTNLMLSWTPDKPGKVQVRIKSTDNITNLCTVSALTQKEGPPPLPNFFARPVPFKETVAVKPKDWLLYHLPIKPGKVTFSIKSQTDARLDIEVTQNGTLVARDLDRKKEFVLVWDASAAGTAAVKINCRDDFFHTLEVGAVAQPIGNKLLLPPLPAVGGLIKKNGPFTEKVPFKPGDNRAYQVSVQPGQCRLNITAKHGAPLLVKVTQNGAMVAEDGGLKADFTLQWKAQIAGDVQVQIHCYDILTNDCTVTFNLDPAQGPVP
jgi:hypothetical protein